MKCLVVDDDILARTVLKQMISTDSSLTLIGECDDAIQAYREIIASQIDILFLDIEMPGMTGIELVKSLEGKRPMIIFTTSTVNYAAEAFDLNVVDFLIKPIVPGRFLQSVEKAREILKTKNLSVSNREDEFVFIRDSNVVRRIKVGEILYMEAMGDYVKIYIEGRVYSIHSSLKSVEQKLSQAVFLRVHRSFIINVSKIDTLEGGTLIINKMLVPVSDAYRSALNKRMQIL
ncbi:LytR/AlgR family response regulator transcription factor [Pedobacter frigoris]|uniref:Response regulator transcription factor n=1 Tax=Pedobacter frigoris TaxID=2571272 RepID=A0A4U1CDM4_9SPHI|nr:LytTR family DNA-binding domain-containing protein [Pedobacter frigoris]TKC05068.1 response regulator transcription factor [Pedobacter frigoris]